MSFISINNSMYWLSDPNKIPDLLDLFMIRGIGENYVEIKGCNELSSDYTSIILTINAMFTRTIRQPVLTNKRTDWDLFRDELENQKKINFRIPLITNEQLDEAAEQLTKVIQQIAWAATPLATTRDISESNYPIKVRELVRKKTIRKR